MVARAGGEATVADEWRGQRDGRAYVVGRSARAYGGMEDVVVAGHHYAAGGGVRALGARQVRPVDVHVALSIVRSRCTQSNYFYCVTLFI